REGPRPCSPRQELHDVIVDRDRVAVRWTLRGTHAGPFIGIAATGRWSRRGRPVCDARWSDGRALERRRPMGVLPAGSWRGQGVRELSEATSPLAACAGAAG